MQRPPSTHSCFSICIHKSFIIIYYVKQDEIQHKNYKPQKGKKGVLERFGSQHSQSGSQAPASPVLGNLKPSSGVQKLLHIFDDVPMHIPRQTHTHIK